MRVAIGADHGGFELKEYLKKICQDKGIETADLGTYSTESCDYPLIADKVAAEIIRGGADFGVLICGTGIGISISANKVKGIRAACCSDCYSAEMTRRHNDANILCFGGRVVGPGLAQKMVELFLKTEFEGGRHARRIAKIADIESRQK